MADAFCDRTFLFLVAANVVSFGSLASLTSKPGTRALSAFDKRVERETRAAFTRPGAGREEAQEAGKINSRV